MLIHRAYSGKFLGAIITSNLVPTFGKNSFVSNFCKWYLFRGCKQADDFVKNLPPKNAPMPPMSRIHPVISIWDDQMQFGGVFGGKRAL